MRVVAGVLAGLALSAGCEERATRRAPRPADARPAPRPARGVSLAPRFKAATPAQRGYDARHRAALQGRLAELRKTLDRLLGLARQGAADPGFRARWPKERDAFLEEVGRLRARVMAVDPLGTRSWAVPVATHLVRELEVRLPDAVRESWDPRPSGALSTAQRDFTLIWGSLRRYVRNLNKEKRKGSSP